MQPHHPQVSGMQASERRPGSEMGLWWHPGVCTHRLLGKSRWLVGNNQLAWMIPSILLGCVKAETLFHDQVCQHSWIPGTAGGRKDKRIPLPLCGQAFGFVCPQNKSKTHLLEKLLEPYCTRGLGVAEDNFLVPASFLPNTLWAIWPLRSPSARTAPIPGDTAVYKAGCGRALSGPDQSRAAWHAGLTQHRGGLCKPCSGSCLPALSLAQPNVQNNELVIASSSSPAFLQGWERGLSAFDSAFVAVEGSSVFFHSFPPAQRLRSHSCSIPCRQEAL